MKFLIKTYFYFTVKIKNKIVLIFVKAVSLLYINKLHIIINKNNKTYSNYIYSSIISFKNILLPMYYHLFFFFLFSHLLFSKTYL